MIAKVSGMKRRKPRVMSSMIFRFRIGISEEKAEATKTKVFSRIVVACGESAVSKGCNVMFPSRSLICWK